jgi:hypothetical protein
MLYSVLTNTQLISQKLTLTPIKLEFTHLTQCYQAEKSELQEEGKPVMILNKTLFSSITLTKIDCFNIMLLLEDFQNNLIIY